MAKPKNLNELCLEFESICQQIDELEVRRQEIKAFFKENGSTETEEFLVSVFDHNYRGLTSILDVCRVFKKTEAFLEKRGLIRSGTSIQVRIKRKK